MAIIVMVATEAQLKEAQERLEQDVADAGIPRILSTAPPFHLMAQDDVPDVTEIAATYRCKPVVREATSEDVPDADETEMETDELVAFVHHLGYLFNWDEDTRQWSVAGVRDGFPDESADMEAEDERSAAIEAIRYLA